MYPDFHKQLVALTKSLEPPYLQFIRQMEEWRISQRPLSFETNINSIIETFRVPLHEMESARQQIIQAMSSTEIERVFEQNKIIHMSWMKENEDTLQSMGKLRATVSAQLATAAQTASSFEKSIANIDFSSALSANRTILDQLQYLFIDTSRGFSAITGLLTPTAIINLPEFIGKDVIRESLISLKTVEELIGTRKDKTDDENNAENEYLQCDDNIDQQLNELKPGFSSIRSGIYESLNSKNPDRIRHILTSLRELFSNLLRITSPDEVVLKWIPKNKPDLIHDDKPTRKARILYICRKINHGLFEDFVEADTKSFVKLFEIFNRIHDVHIPISDRQLKALLYRTDSMLQFLLNISRESTK